MMRSIFILLAFLITTSSFGQSKTWEAVVDTLEAASVDYLNAYAKSDWDQYMSFAHPNIVELAGGKEILIKMATETIEMYKSLGYDIKSGKIVGDIETVDSEEGIQAIIPAAIVMSTEGQDDLETPVMLFAISSDAGVSWRFVDLSQYDQTSFKTFVPEFNESLFEYWK